MMNKRNIYILGWLMLAACTPFEGVNPDGTDGDGNLPPVALEIGKVQMPGVYHEKGTNAGTRSAETRATTYTDYTGNIGFFRQAIRLNDEYKAVNNRKGELVTRTVIGTGASYQAWVPTDDDPDTKTDSIWLKEKEATLAVYAPYDAAHTSVGKLTLTPGLLTGTDAEKAKKFIYAKTFKANRQTAHQATLKLEHLYTRLTFAVKRQSYYLDRVVLSRLSLQSSPQGVFINPTMSCRYNLFSTDPATAYEHYPSSLATDFTIADVASTIAATPNPTQNANAGATIDLLMAPTDLSAINYLLLSLTVDGQVMKTALAPTLFANTPSDVSTAKLEAGKHYTVNLILTPKLLEVAEVTVEDWIDEASITYLDPKFDAEPGIRLARDEIFPYSDCGDAEKDVLAGLTWAEGNLASVDRLVGPDLKQYEWTVYPEEYGIYYTGRISHGALDLCKLLLPEKYGTDWRLPYQWEFDALIKCSQFPNVHTYTSPDGGTKESRYIQCLNDFYGVKLPCAGFSSAQKQQQEQSEASAYPTDEEGIGYYWLEMDEDMLKNNKGFPYIQLDTYSGYYTYGYIPMSDSGGRYTAYSMRCVKGTSVAPPGWTTK